MRKTGTSGQARRAASSTVPMSATTLSQPSFSATKPKPPGAAVAPWPRWSPARTA